MTEQQAPQIQQIGENRIAIPATIKCPTCSTPFHMVIDLGVNGLAPTPEQQLEESGFKEVADGTQPDGTDSTAVV